MLLVVTDNEQVTKWWVAFYYFY